MTRRRKDSRGSMLLELILAAGILALIVTAATSMIASALRMVTRIEYQEANLNTVSAEMSRLRALPLAAFYESDGVTPRTSPLRYYRVLSVPRSSFSNRVYAEFDLTVTPVNLAGGPVQITLVARPRYIGSGVAIDPATGVGSTTGTPTARLPNGIDFGDTQALQSAIIL